MSLRLHNRGLQKSRGLGILLLVLLLTVIPVVLLVVVIAAVTVARRQRQGWVPAPPVPGFRKHLFAAVEHDVSRTPREVASQTVESITAKKTWDALPENQEKMISVRKPPARLRREEMSGAARRTSS